MAEELESADKRFNVNVYAVVRVKVIGAGGISKDPRVVAEKVTDAVCADSKQWLNPVHGTATTADGKQLDIEQVEFAEGISAVMVDELRDVREEIIEHRFDHAGENLRPYPGCHTVREGVLQEQVNELTERVAALERGGDLSAFMRWRAEQATSDWSGRTLEDMVQAFLAQDSDEDEGEEVSLDEVAEWVGLHYGVNFDAESQERRQDWIDRYREMHEEAPKLAVMRG